MEEEQELVNPYHISFDNRLEEYRPEDCDEWIDKESEQTEYVIS